MSSECAQERAVVTSQHRRVLAREANPAPSSWGAEIDCVHWREATEWPPRFLIPMRSASTEGS
jgi:hypothetical protein